VFDHMWFVGGDE